ncbi:MAG: hypothetical protein R3308_04560 [Thiohalobacterales bacterium]|nr:hypothetical protein [Thiohalobacterales bacterium]
MKKWSARVLAAVVAITAAQAVAAPRWEARAGATPSVTYSNNICLSDKNEKHGYYGSLTPYGSITGESRNAAVNLNGSVNLNSLTNSFLRSKDCNADFNERTQYNPNIRGSFRAKLIPNLMNITGNLRVRDDEINSRNRNSFDDLQRSGTSNTVYRYKVVPSMERRLGSRLRAKLDYTYDEVINTNDLAVDNRRQGIGLVFRQQGAAALKLSLSGRYSEVDYGENINGVARDDTKLSYARLGFNYKVSRSLTVDGNIGKEWNNIESVIPLDDDDNLWQANIKWAPSRRTAVLLGLGDRFFGKTPRVDINHQRKNHSFGLRYRRELRFRTDLNVDDIFAFIEDPDRFYNPNIFSTTPIIDERVDVGWAYNGRGASITLSGNYSQQKRTLDDVEVEFKDVFLTYRPRTSGRINYSASVGWQDDEPRNLFNNNEPIPGEIISDESYYMRLQASRSYTSGVNLSASYRMVFRDEDSPGNEYQEFRLSASYNFSI